MNSQTSLEHILIPPKGNTQPGVLQKIYDFLQDRQINPKTILDIPCGKGEFLAFLKQAYPMAKMIGVDLFEKPLAAIEKDFIKSDMRVWDFAKNQKFDLIFSVSGIMQCDDLFGFFEKAEQHLNSGGHLIVTNDNVLTIRDRISFFCFGEVKRFRKYFSTDEGNWNLVLIPALIKHFEMKKFQEVEIQYCSLKTEDLAFAVFIPFFWTMDMLHLLLAKSDWPIKKRFSVYTWKHYLFRHYFISGKKTS